jgi:hypothetical protein
MAMFGFSRRSDGKLHADFLCDPATGQDRPVVKAVRRARGELTECPTCGGIGTLGLRLADRSTCDDSWHETCGKTR